MTLTSQQQDLKQRPAWPDYLQDGAALKDGLPQETGLDGAIKEADNKPRIAAHLGEGFGPASQLLLDSMREPMSKYLTLATSLTSQLGGGLKSRANTTAAQPGAMAAATTPKPWASPIADEAQSQPSEVAQEVGDQLSPLSPSLAAPPPPPVAPLLASMTGAGAKGRPLNRLAMNRAKFAIRSYTIAVSCLRSSAYHWFDQRRARI